MVLSNFKSTDKIVICTDSLTGLDSLVSTKAHKKEPLVRRLQDTIIRASKKVKELKFIWVPAHMAIYDNEQADYGADYATTSLTDKFQTIKYAKKTEEQFFEELMEKKQKYDPGLEILNETMKENEEPKKSGKRKQAQKQNGQILFTEFQELMTSMKKCKEDLTQIQTRVKTEFDVQSLTELALLTLSLDNFEITLNRIESSVDVATDEKLTKSK
jgi:hypothetical protein